VKVKQTQKHLPLLPVYFGLGAVLGSFVGSFTGLIVLSILIGAVLGLAGWGLEALLNTFPWNEL